MCTARVRILASDGLGGAELAHELGRPELRLERFGCAELEEPGDRSRARFELLGVFLGAGEVGREIPDLIRDPGEGFAHPYLHLRCALTDFEHQASCQECFDPRGELLLGERQPFCLDVGYPELFLEQLDLARRDLPTLERVPRSVSAPLGERLPSLRLEPRQTLA